MPILTDPVIEERRKHGAALQRAVPITRMADYGVPLGDAIQVHESVAQHSPPAWDDACEMLASRQARLAEESGRAGLHLTAADAWRAASALLQCAQLAYNEDLPRKKRLYADAQAAMQQHAALSGDLLACRLPAGNGQLHAWILRPLAQPVRAAVVVLGGLSGWGASYLDMGRALAARGMLAILGEGPGQGLTRMQAGLHLDVDTLALFGRFVDHAVSLGAQRVGVLGNSFGGLLAAQLAVRDARVRAACINGAPMVPTVPGFRTAREQMQAVFGTSSPDDLAAAVQALALDPQRQRTDAALLVVQGGRDPLVPLGSQAGFLALSSSAVRSTLTWDDGEHTIYNHSRERNNRIADWFARQLGAGP